MKDIDELIEHLSRWQQQRYINAANEWLLRQGHEPLRDISRRHGCCNDLLSRVIQVKLLEQYGLLQQYHYLANPKK